jgi:hypothetical protein
MTDIAEHTGGKTVPADEPGFLTALVTEHFALQGARSIGTSEATSRAALYVATLSSALIATGFASGKAYFGPFLAAVLIVVLVLGQVTLLRLVALSRADLRLMRDIHVIHRYYRSLSPSAQVFFKEADVDDLSALIALQGEHHSRWLILSSAAALIAILNSAVLGAGLTILTSAISGGFHGWQLAIGVAGAAIMGYLTLRFEHTATSTALR